MLDMCYVINWHGKETMKIRFDEYITYKNLRDDTAMGRDDL
jgi:hypothetical protein